MLAEKTVARNSSGNKIMLSSIERIETKMVHGQAYWYYEHISQASPSLIRPGTKDNFRHAISVSTVRTGLIDQQPYIYTLKVTSPESLWPQVVDLAMVTVNSFRLMQMDETFVTPEKYPFFIL